MKNWLVVANASRARVPEAASDADGYTHVADLVHAQSRQKGVALRDDRPGFVKGIGHGLGSARYVARTDPREHGHERFAREVAAVLDEGLGAGRCGGLVLVASSDAELAQRLR